LKGKTSFFQREETVLKVEDSRWEYILNKSNMKINLEKTYEAITASGDIALLDMKTLLSFSEKTLLYFYPKDDTP
jgi:hypothetical protein